MINVKWFSNFNFINCNIQIKKFIIPIKICLTINTNKNILERQRKIIEIAGLLTSNTENIQNKNDVNDAKISKKNQKNQKMMFGIFL